MHCAGVVGRFGSFLIVLNDDLAGFLGITITSLTHSLALLEDGGLGAAVHGCWDE